MTGTVTQHALFAAPPSSAATSSKPLPEKPSSETQTSEKPAPMPARLTTEELIEHIFQSMCKGRRWQRELLLGATDPDLGRSFGNCWCSAQTIELQFRRGGEPALRAVDAVFKIEVLTLSAPEIGSHIRRIVGVPQLKSDEERKPHSIVFSLTCASTFAANYCPTFEARGNHDALAAAKHAVSIIEAANRRWRSAIAYWQDTDEPTSYQPPTRAKSETTSSSEPR